MKKNLGLFISDEILRIYVIFIKKLPELKLKKIFKRNQDYSPKELSPFFYDYFIYEDKNEKNAKFKYVNNKIRKMIESNLIDLKIKNNLKTYKFTGPASIGKSFTLFYLSRIIYNIIYINLKVLNNNKNNLYYCYQIIITELERITIYDKLFELNSLINNCYEKQLSPLDLILNIMEFLFTNSKTNFIFIFDQYKKKYLIDKFNSEIIR